MEGLAELLPGEPVDLVIGMNDILEPGMAGMPTPVVVVATL
jgi:hypothetical protein